MSSEAKEEKTPEKKVLSLGGSKLELKKPVDKKVVDQAGMVGTVKQSFTHGRSKTVAVEVKRKRDPAPTETQAKTGAPAPATTTTTSDGQTMVGLTEQGRARSAVIRQLTAEERAARVQALRGAMEEEKRDHAPETTAYSGGPRPGEIVRHDAPPTSDSLRARELEEMRQIQELEKQQAALDEMRRVEEESKRKGTAAPAAKKDGERALITPKGFVRAGATTEDEEDEDAPKNRRVRTAGKAVVAPKKEATQEKRRGGSNKISLSQIRVSDDEVEVVERTRSMASARRAREKEKRQLAMQDQQKIVRDVTIPEVITVQELSNRMAERAGDVIKTLMKLGVMATITQTIDADTAELVATEFGHRVKRVSEADVETNLETGQENEADMRPRAPVVTIMGHVDHGKTSLLDAIRQTNVVSREAGGITQHIGAYQVQIPKGTITFIDTPGHAAFTEMRARGANVTDVVVLVVAADDGIMPQTIEAITHAKAAKVPIIVAINKCDLPAANPSRVRQELLQHDIQVEEMGGETLSVEVSAKTRKGLDKLLETILLQSEVLELKANPNRTGKGVVVEAQMDKGRGAVATVLVQQGTIRVGEIYVSGLEWGRVRALINDRGEMLQQALPAQPVEVLGLSGVPLAGDDFTAVESEARAREICDFRLRRKRAASAVATATKSSLEEMFTSIREGVAKELPVLIKGDVQGSVEAIRGALAKVAGDSNEVRVKVLDTGVGAISESDITLARASKAFIIGFNVRANPQAREMAKRDGVEIRYYSIIYNILDDVKQMLSGLLAPDVREKFLGYASILQVFNISKVGKVAGCKVTEGVVKRGAKVRLLRDSVVIHEGMLKTLKRIKDEVKEVREGYECGMAFENYDNIQEGDQIECFEIEEVARQL